LSLAGVLVMERKGRRGIGMEGFSRQVGLEERTNKPAAEQQDGEGGDHRGLWGRDRWGG
jgi:hypothetical protein